MPFEHDAFATAKASAYSSILTFFPALLVLGSVLRHRAPRAKPTCAKFPTRSAASCPLAAATAIAYLKGTTQRPVGLLITTSLLTLWTASGVDDFLDGRFSARLPAAQDLGAAEGAPDRVLAGYSWPAFPLTFATILVAFGSRHRDPHPVSHRTRVRAFMSAAVDGHPLVHCHPHQHRGDRADLPQCRAPHPALAQRVARARRWRPALWFRPTTLFGWYLQRYADYSIIYGSLGVGIALLVWMYMISLVRADWRGVQCHAFFPRARLGIELIETNAHLKKP